MKRLLGVAVLASAGLGGWGSVGHQVAFAATGGNSAAAHLCQQGGYASLIGTNGTTDMAFTNTGQCVSYAAHGGTLVSSTTVAPCLNGGYQTLYPAGSSTPFPSEAACVQYILNGGTPATLPTFVLTSPTTLQASANQCYQGATNVTVNQPALYNTGTSGNPGSTLCFQSDGNLVIYSASGTPLWSSGTYGHPEATLAFQSDGNLVIYSSTTPLFNTQTYNHPGDCVVFQSDGNLVVYTSCG